MMSDDGLFFYTASLTVQLMEQNVKGVGEKWEEMKYYNMTW